jgi:hypothetical protein
VGTADLSDAYGKELKHLNVCLIIRQTSEFEAIYNISHLCIWPVQLRHLFFLTTTMYMVASAV